MSETLGRSVQLRLRPTTLADLDFVLKAEQASDNSPFVGQWSRQQHRQAFSTSSMAHLIAEDLSENTPVGYIILTDLQDPNRSINLKRIVITAKGKGYGRAALELIKKLAFEEWQAHRLWLDVKAFNSRARQLYTRVGFVEEGILRQCLKVGDNYESLVIMSILQNEYR